MTQSCQSNTDCPSSHECKIDQAVCCPRMRETHARSSQELQRPSARSRCVWGIVTGVCGDTGTRRRPGSASPSTTRGVRATTTTSRPSSTARPTVETPPVALLFTSENCSGAPLSARSGLQRRNRQIRDLLHESGEELLSCQLRGSFPLAHSTCSVTSTATCLGAAPRRRTRVLCPRILASRAAPVSRTSTTTTRSLRSARPSNSSDATATPTV